MVKFSIRSVDWIDPIFFIAMAYNPNKELKRYYSIQEVSDMVQVPKTTLRYWESEFDELSPKKTSKGVRQYTVKDIETIEHIALLVKQQRHTIEGARSIIKSNGKRSFDRYLVVSKLQSARDELQQIYQELNATPPCGKPF